MTRTGRRRFPILFAPAGAALALLFSPVQAQDGSAPAKPTGLTAVVSHDSVTLAWDDPQDDSITIDAFVMKLNGGSMKRKDTTVDAALTHTRVAAAGGQRVNRPARVQTTFVSNLEQTDVSRDSITYLSSQYAQQFETGSNSGGYTLTEIVVNIRDAQTGTPAFALYTSTSDDKPDTKVVDLSGNSSTEGEQSFTSASTTTLNASTKYFIVFYMTSGQANLQRTDSDDIDSEASPGWDIAENSLFFSGATWMTSSDSVEIAINGTATAVVSTDATLSDLVVNNGSADLTLTPTFASGDTSYTAMVANDVAEVTVTPTTNDTGATIEYLDGDDATITDAGTADGHQVAVVEGDNVIKVKVTAADGNTTETYTVMVNRAAANNAPAFPSATLTRTVPENTAANQNVGAAIPAATDADAGDTLTYSMEGADAASFTFEASTRQIRTTSGVTYDYEAKPSYSVTIRVLDSTASDTIDVTITVTDEDEPPAVPAAPTLTATAGSTTSLDVSWTAPANEGKPPITSYDLRYRVGSSGSWTDGPQDVTVTTAAISGLTAATEYQVQVRAINAEGDSGWSAAGTGRAARTNAGHPRGDRRRRRRHADLLPFTR